MAARRHDADAGQDLDLAVGPALGAPIADELQLRLDVAGDDPQVWLERDGPFGPLGDDSRPRKAARTGRVEEAAGVVEVKVAHRYDVDGRRVVPRGPQSREDRRTLVAAHLARLVVDPLTNPRLDEDPPGGRLDEEAVQRLEQAMIGIDLIGDEAVPQDPWHRPEQRARVRAEGPRLDPGEALRHIRPCVRAQRSQREERDHRRDERQRHKRGSQPTRPLAHALAEQEQHDRAQRRERRYDPREVEKVPRAHRRVSPSTDRRRRR